MERSLLSEEKAIATTTMTGRIHSVETCGTVDGPGIRFVVFTQGCPLRCLYCHNPDCRPNTEGQWVTAAQLMAEIQTYASYIRSPGGVTISGGEPLMQPKFVRELFRQCKTQGIHTTLDTSGYVNLTAAKPVLEETDLVLLDIKSFNSKTYFQVTNVSIEPTLEFAKYLSEIQKPVWIRFVLVPGLTDDVENITGLAKFVAGLDNVERVEILPFHKMGEYKWEQLGYDYRLKETQPPTAGSIEQAVKLFEKFAAGKYSVICQS